MSNYMITSSMKSRSTVAYDTYSACNIGGMSDYNLVREVNKMKRLNHIMALENEIFEHTLEHRDPTLLVGVQETVDFALKTSYGGTGSCSSLNRTEMPNVPRLMSTMAPRASRKLSMTKLSGFHILQGPKINNPEKTDLIHAELDFLEEHFRKISNLAAKRTALLKAQLEEIDVRVAEIEKASINFEIEVKQNGWDHITQRIPAEAWIQYMIMWTKIADKAVSKMRLKISTLHTHYRRTKIRKKLKAELTERLRPVDFEMLDIENKHFKKTVDRNYWHLMEIKKITAAANFNLTTHRQAMIDQLSYLAKIKETIDIRYKQLDKMEIENGKIDEQVQYFNGLLDKLKRKKIKFVAPEIIEFVELKSEIVDLKKVIAVLTNRLRIYKRFHARQKRKAEVTKKVYDKLNL